MTAAVWLVARADLRRRWRGIVVVAVLVGLAGGATLAGVAGARRTASSFDRFREEANARDVFLLTTGVDRDAVDRALALPLVEQAAEGVAFYGGLEDPFDFFVVAGKDPRFGATIERPRIITGRMWDPAAADEVIVTEKTADALGLGVGDTVTFRAFTPEQFEKADFFGFEGPTIALRVVGTYLLPQDLLGADDVPAIAGPAFHERYRRTVATEDGAFAITLDGGPGTAPAFERRVGAVLPSDQEWAITPSGVENRPVRTSIALLAVSVLAFAAVAGVAGGVQAGQALSRSVAAAAGERDALAALGLGRRHQALVALAPGAVAAVGGAVLAGLVASATSPLLPIGLARRAEPDPGLSLDWVVLGPGAAAVGALTLAWAAVVAWRVSGAPAAGAAAATAALHPSKVGAGLARLGLGPTTVIGARMALEPGRGRTAVPVRSALVGAVVGVVGVVGALTFGASLDRLVDTPARWGFNWDLTPDVADGDEDFYAANPDVADLARMHAGPIRLEGRPLQAVALEPLKGSPSLTLRSGRPPMSADEVVLGPETLAELDAQVGDEVVAPTRSGGTERLRVVGTALFPFGDDEGFDRGAALTVEGLDRFNEGEKFTEAVLSWREGVDPEEAERRLELPHPEALLYARPEPPGEVANLGDVDTLPLVLAALLAVLAVSAVAHAVVMSVRRRRRDLAVLQAVGFTRRQVVGTVSWQATVLVAVGLVGGVPLGLALGRWAWAGVAARMGAAPDPAWPLAALVVLPLAAVALGNLVAWHPGRRAARSGAAAALRTE